MAEEKKATPKKATAKKEAPKKDTEKKETAKKATTKKAATKKDSAKVDDAKKEAPKAEKLLEYKGKPLVRCGNTVYYGDMNEPYVICLNIKNSNDYKDIKLADDVTIQLISTDETLSPKDIVIKKSEKKGLFTALDLGCAWLERQLKKG